MTADELRKELKNDLGYIESTVQKVFWLASDDTCSFSEIRRSLNDICAYAEDMVASVGHYLDEDEDVDE